MKPKLPSLQLSVAFLFLLSFSSILFAEVPKDDVWVAEEMEHVGVIASVNGRIVHGDRFRVRMEETKCLHGEKLFSFYTTEDNKDISKLEGKAIQIKYNQKVTNAKILFSQNFLLGHSVMFHLGFELIDSILNTHKGAQEISISLFDSESFKASDYFDVLENCIPSTESGPFELKS